MKIPVAFVTDKGFVMQVGVVIYMLSVSRKPHTEYDIYVVMADCSKEDEQEVMQLKSDGVDIHILRDTLKGFDGIRQIAHISVAGLLKFRLCDLITKYDKLLYLDGDLLIRGDLTELYKTELGNSYVAGVADLESIHEGKRLMNSGVMVLNARKIRNEHLSETLLETRKSLGDRRSMDQQTINLVMGKSMIFLPVCFNCVPHKLLGPEKKSYPIEKVNALYGSDYRTNKDLVNAALIVHFATTGKPWLYQYISCSDEWYQYYMNSPFGGKKLHRQTYFQAHFEGLLRQIGQGGYRAAVKRMGELVRTRLGKKDRADWG